MSRREFHFSEGGSSKFWAIEVDGPRFTVQFGRLGTKGQTKTTELGSAAAAQQAADKLIAEKTKKGYAEVGAATAPAPAAVPAKFVETKQAPPAASAPPAAAATTRTIALEPADWYMATWRKLSPLPLPADASGPFDPAGFRTEIEGELKRRKIEVAPASVPGATPWPKAADAIVDVFLDTKAMAKLPRGVREVRHWFLKFIVPYVPPSVWEARRDEMRDLLKSLPWPSDPYDPPPPVFHFAGAAGLHDELLAVVSSWPDDAYGRSDWDDFYHQPQMVVFGLGSAELVNRHMRRLRLRLKFPEYARAWLAHTELSELDYLRDTIAGVSDRQKAEKLFAVLALARAPEAAPHVLSLRRNSKAARPASDWLDANAGITIAGLIPVAAGQGQLAAAAVEYLRGAKKRGHADFIAEQLKGAPSDVAARVRSAVLEHEEKVYELLDVQKAPKPLRDALASGTPAGSLRWAAPAELPPLVVGGRRLDDNAVSLVLGSLRRTALGAPDPLLSAVREHVEPASRDAFSWRLFEGWLTEGAPSKEKWALLAVGHLGTDATALRLTPLVRAWPGESQHARAVTGLECLRAIGSDTALMQLNGIAQKLKFQGLKNKAREFMEAIAKDRGLSPAELEDRIVPDLDLDERGGRTFDFGPRQFRVVLGPDLSPLVRGDDGKAKADLPKPGAKDDAEKANAAVAEWKLLKKQLREVLKVQAPRLEQAMVTGRRWTAEQFETLLVRHPLMTNLARRLVWGGYDGKAKLASTFRVTQEGEYSDVEDRPFALKGLALVGIVHPLHLTEGQRAAWGEVLADYEIIAPFPQLGRPVLAPEPEEAKGTTITRLAKTNLPAFSVRGTLEKSGWTRGSAADHGVIQEYFKPFPGSGVTSLLELDPGIPLGLPEWTEDQRVPRVFFLGRIYSPTDYPYHKEKDFLPLNKVDAVAVSEVLADLALLATKAK
jgi:predicted DNA-binding WGR domain protein